MRAVRGRKDENPPRAPRAGGALPPWRYPYPAAGRARGRRTADPRDPRARAPTANASPQRHASRRAVKVTSRLPAVPAAARRARARAAAGGPAGRAVACVETTVTRRARGVAGGRGRAGGPLRPPSTGRVYGGGTKTRTRRTLDTTRVARDRPHADAATPRTVARTVARTGEAVRAKRTHKFTYGMPQGLFTRRPVSQAATWPTPSPHRRHPFSISGAHGHGSHTWLKQPTAADSLFSQPLQRLGPPCPPCLAVPPLKPAESSSFRWARRSRARSFAATSASCQRW